MPDPADLHNHSFSKRNLPRNSEDCRVNQTPQLEPIVSQMNPVHTLTSYAPQCPTPTLHPHIFNPQIFQAVPHLQVFRLRVQFCLHFYATHFCYVFYQSDSLLFVDSNNRRKLTNDKGRRRNYHFTLSLDCAFGAKSNIKQLSVRKVRFF
jgi:hypothetical protein